MTRKRREMMKKPIRKDHVLTSCLGYAHKDFKQPSLSVDKHKGNGIINTSRKVHTCCDDDDQTASATSSSVVICLFVHGYL